MNPKESEAREFWIIDEAPYGTWVSSKPLNPADTREETHVIEFSAVEELRLENKRLQEMLAAYKKYFDAAEVIRLNNPDLTTGTQWAEKVKRRQEALDSSKGEK